MTGGNDEGAGGTRAIQISVQYSVLRIDSIQMRSNKIWIDPGHFVKQYFAKVVICPR